MAFTTLVDYSRQLTQTPNTSAVFSGDTEILGSLTLGSIYSNGLSDYSELYFSSSTLTTSPSIRYNPLLKNWLFKVSDPTDASATEFQLNRVKFTLNSAGMNGEFGMFSQQSFFRHTSNDMDGIQNSGYHNPATVMVVGSGITSSSTAFTVSNFASGVGKTGFTVDDAMNVFIGDMRPQVVGTSTSHVWLRGNTLNNVESHKTLMIGTDGQVGVNTSLRALKQNIDYEYDSSWIYDLKPVEFEFRKFPGKIEYGFIAEDVYIMEPMVMNGMGVEI